MEVIKLFSTHRLSLWLLIGSAECISQIQPIKILKLEFEIASVWRHGVHVDIVNCATLFPLKAAYIGGVVRLLNTGRHHAHRGCKGLPHSTWLVAAAGTATVEHARYAKWYNVFPYNENMIQHTSWQRKYGTIASTHKYMYTTFTIAWHLYAHRFVVTAYMFKFMVSTTCVRL